MRQRRNVRLARSSQRGCRWGHMSIATICGSSSRLAELFGFQNLSANFALTPRVCVPFGCQGRVRDKYSGSSLGRSEHQLQLKNTGTLALRGSRGERRFSLAVRGGALARRCTRNDNQHSVRRRSSIHEARVYPKWRAKYKIIIANKY